MASITATLTHGYTVRLESSEGHTWTADEPEDVGGADEGPNPYELLLGALAACTCITVSMYAQRKDWALERIDVVYEHDRVHADDCAECDDDRTGFIDRIRSRVTIEGDLDDAARTRLAEVAARCPVHKTLEKGVHLVDEVAFA